MGGKEKKPKKPVTTSKQVATKKFKLTVKKGSFKTQKGPAKLSSNNGKSRKRNNNDKSTPPTNKRSKPNPIEDDSDEIRQPTHEELKESLKPENTMNIETIRQNKRDKHRSLQENKQTNLTGKERTKNVAYLQKWKQARDQWKFEKLRQVSIQNGIFDEHEIPQEVWSTALEYLEGTKGGSRDFMVNESERILEDIDAQYEQSNDAELLKQIRYIRARDLIQTLQ